MYPPYEFFMIRSQPQNELSSDPGVLRINVGRGSNNYATKMPRPITTVVAGLSLIHALKIYVYEYA